MSGLYKFALAKMDAKLFVPSSPVVVGKFVVGYNAHDIHDARIERE